tara:strand:+ start:409 stop:1035 length:627 start_codon:yes stop_codon:yes gene_type:complete
MLEALIRTKDSENSDKCCGDVICLKLKEHSDWGALERRVHQVVDWEDEQIESQMRADFKNTGVPPVLITPYKEVENTTIYDDDGFKIAEKQVTKTRSKKFFNINKIADESLKAKIQGDFEEVVLDNNMGLIEDKSEQQILDEFIFNKNAERLHAIQNKINYILESKKDRKQLNDLNLNYLRKQLWLLRKRGVNADIVDGKIVRRENDG